MPASNSQALSKVCLELATVFPEKGISFRESQFRSKYPEGIVVTESLRSQIKTAIASKNLPIVIEGETGTGKEQIVQHIHRQLSKTSEMPLVILNCASLRGDLAASTLFGHKKGAFTGANEHSIGAIGRANRGILFLDEFHRLPIVAQEQLLRTLQDGSYQRVGDTTDYHSSFRLVVATPKNIEQHAIDGEILMDIRFRLYGAEITIPPLRDRLYQLDELIECFMIQYGQDLTLSSEQRQLLVQLCSQYYWQGNIRQLFGVLQSVCLKARMENRGIFATDLPTHPTMLPPPQIADRNQIFSKIEGDNTAHSVTHQEHLKLIKLIQNYTEKPYSYDEFIATFERELMGTLWNKFSSVKGLCQAIKLPRSTLYAKRQRLNIDEVAN